MYLDSNIDSVELYAAVVSTIVAAWQVYSFLQDRAKLKVEALYGRTHPLDIKQGAADEEYAIVSVANHGRRVQTIIAAGFRLDDGKQIIIESPELPMLLGESTPAVFKSPISLIGDRPVVAWVRDSRNKLHTSEHMTIQRHRS